MNASTGPDYIALAMVGVMFVILIIMIVRKRLSDKAAAKAEQEAVQSALSAEAPGTAGQIRLNGVPPKTAAMVMAIAASKTGKPINQLRFISIREVKE